jgi:hypothetical protein
MSSTTLTAAKNVIDDLDVDPVNEQRGGAELAGDAEAKRAAGGLAQTRDPLVPEESERADHENHAALDQC